MNALLEELELLISERKALIQYLISTDSFKQDLMKGNINKVKLNSFGMTGVATDDGSIRFDIRRFELPETEEAKRLAADVDSAYGGH